MMRRSHVGLLSALTLSAASASARADDREQARSEFLAGQDADNAHNFVGAIEHYVAANRLSPHPFALYNIATDYERLGKLRDAATYYQRYLDTAPDSPDRARVLAQIDDLKTRPSAVTVRTLPAGARIVIDGAVVGPAPFTTRLPGGPHAITADLSGRGDRRDIVVEYGEPVDVPFDLRGSSGPVVVTVVPPDMLGQGMSGTLPGGLFAGGGGGADLQGAGTAFFATLGARGKLGELAVDAGFAAGLYAGAHYRFNIGAARVVPFVGVGYALALASDTGKLANGFAAEAGARLVLQRHAHRQIELRVSGGARYNLAGPVDSADSAATMTFPVMLTLEVATR
jgi:hypothetical protein